MKKRIWSNPYITCVVSIFAGLAVLLCVIGIVYAQQVVPGATAVQQVQPLFSCNQQNTATGLGNAAVVVTFTPPAGQAFYICSIHIAETANATVTVAAGPGPIFTSAGLQNALIWWGDNSALAQGVEKVLVEEIFPIPLRAQTGTAFTITTSAGQATQNVRLNVTGFFAP
jgi:hypothetical protein